MNNDILPDIGPVTTATIDGLTIRYARSGSSTGIPILMTAPWPESIYSFYRVVPLLSGDHPLLLVDLPGYGQSQSRPEVMAPEAMGDFLLSVLSHFGITRAHVVAPDVGTPAVLFAAAKSPNTFESLVVGGGAMRAEFAAGTLKDLIHTPSGALSNVDGAIGMKNYLTEAAKLTPAPVVDDFRAASAGRRLEEAVQYVRNYIPDLPKLEPRLAGIKTPVLILAGKKDPIVPPVNGQFLADRLPVNRYILLDAAHRIWEEARPTYAGALIAWFGGDYATVGKNKALVLEAFDTLFNKRDYASAERFWSPNYIQHSAHIPPGRDGLFNLVKAGPPSLKYEHGMIVTEGDLVIVHGRYSNTGLPANWIVADIVRIENGVLAEHWDVIQDEVTKEQSKSGNPMFGIKFAAQ